MITKENHLIKSEWWFEMYYQEWELKDSQGKTFTYWVINLTKDWNMCRELRQIVKETLRTMSVSWKTYNSYYWNAYTKEELLEMFDTFKNKQFIQTSFVREEHSFNYFLIA